MTLVARVIRKILVVAVLSLPCVAVLAPAAQGQAAVGRSVVVNGASLYFEEQGSGPPLLLLHYFGGCGGSWGPHREALARTNRLIVVDLPGHGRSGSRGTWTHQHAAVDVIALLDSLGLTSVPAIGMSSGGMTLLHVATMQPSRLTALVLVGATSYFGEEARAIFSRSQWETMGEAERAEWGACSRRGEDQTEEIVDWFHDFVTSYDDMDFTAPRLSTIAAPTLIVHGDRDEFFPIEIPVEMYESIPDARLWIVPGGDHIPIFGERAEAFQREVLTFLEITRAR